MCSCRVRFVPCLSISGALHLAVLDSPVTLQTFPVDPADAVALFPTTPVRLALNMALKLDVSPIRNLPALLGRGYRWGLRLVSGLASFFAS